ncbi:MAG: serine/threonine protein kinase [Polyangiaceae bacterium]
MEFAEIQQTVERRAKVDIGPHLAQYREKARPATVEGFLSYLRAKNVIDVSLFTELHTRDAVDTSAATLVDAKSTVALPFRATVYAPTPGDGVATKVSTDPATNATKSSPHGSGFASVDTSATRVSNGGAAPESPAEEEEPPQYEVLGELGKGAMGEVHLARDVLLRRKVAMKSILPHMQQHQQLFSRFLAEMQITAQLDHPFIVPVYGVETGPSGGLAYAMKLVQGREFGDLLEETKAMLDAGKTLDEGHSLEARLEAFLKVCDAISYAHERGIVHRDLKPANIMLGRFNEVYVMDWGIARLMGKGGKALDQGVELYDADGSDARQTTRTRLGSTIGTPIYMSPEQAAGRNDELDGRSDLYSLGLILQEIVTLTQAVSGTTLQEVLTNAKDGKRLPPEPPKPGMNVPRELRAIIEKSTRFKPEERYASVKDFADDIRRYLRNEEIVAQPDTGLQRAGRWTSKHRMATIALLLGVLVVGAGATIGVLLYNRSVVAAQHNRELRLAELQASSAVRAQELDATLQNYETLLTRMVGAAGLALGEVRQGDATLHFSDEFKDGPNALPGLVNSKVYGGRVSLDWPVASVAPGTTKEAIARDIGSLNTLRGLARSIMLESLDPNYRSMPEADRQKVLADTGVPIARIALTLESGLHIEYPGMAGVAPDFDGRKTPAYQAASTSFEVEWGKPTPGRSGGMVLPATAPLRDDQGRLLGVLEFEVDINRAVSSALDTSGASAEYVESSLLVEKDGKVVAQNNSAGAAPEAEVLGMPAVREAIARGESGYVETQRGGKDVLVTYHPLSTVDWYLVTVADVHKVEKTAPPPPQGSAKPGSVAASKPPVKATAAAVAPPPPKVTATPAPIVTATASATESATASASASTSASESAVPSVSTPVPPPSGTYWRPPVKSATAPPVKSTPAPSTTAPPNPFDPWKVYDKDKDKKP